MKISIVQIFLMVISAVILLFTILTYINSFKIFGYVSDTLVLDIQEAIRYEFDSLIPY